MSVSIQRASPNQQTIAEPPGGWAEFVDAYWEQKPLLFKNQLAPIASDFEIFSLSVKAAKHLLETAPTLKNIKERNLRFFIEHSPVNMGLSNYLPRIEDGALDAYTARLAEVLNDRDFTLITNNAQSYSYDVWQRVRRFVSGLYAIIGTPLNSQIITYVSKSKRTAVGVHKDPNSNFLFQLRGHKRFRLWPSRVFQSRPHLVRGIDYAEIADEALFFALEPGDVLYMPSDYYHLAEADDEVSVHVSIIVDVINEMGSQIVMDLAARMVSNRLSGWQGQPFFSLQENNDPMTKQVPRFLTPVVQAFSDLNEGLQESVINELLRRSSSLGCNLPPPLLETVADLMDDDLVQANQESLISSHSMNGQFYFAANGHGFGCPAHPQAVQLIQTAGDGKTYRVKDLIDSYTELGAGNVRNLLETLCRIRAIYKL